ncbi:MAG: sensor histidine kinase [Anaerolineaceae bacterium]|nr:sensor histidine kinase [Anaerolineaceae bacterium]
MEKQSDSQLGKQSITQQINGLLLPIFVVMGVMVAVFSVMLLSINYRYEDAMQSAVLAADFNKEFKDTLDLAMYNHVIQPRTKNSIAQLPMEELDKAEAVLTRLETVTTLPDNKWRIQSMLYMCRNLRMYMTEIALTESYDLRMEMLDKNIRGETGLTTLIERYMHDFVGDEVEELARLRVSLNRQSAVLIGATVISMIILFVIIVTYSMVVNRRITNPIIALTEKAKQFGKRDFSQAKPIHTNITELEILDDSFNEMTGHITSLMKKQIENERSLHQAELELLQAQINPHFLYNTLDSIVILAESDRSEDAVDMITSLSTFFRNSLSEGADIHTIRAEFAQAESYLKIQQIRYSDILAYSINVSDEIQNRLIPKLILQPLIENALYHGIKNRRGKGLITITGTREGEKIFLRVHDNGAGMDQERLDMLQNGIYQEKRGSFGLWNVHQRIRLYCGESYGLSFESTPGEGTTVTVTLPAEGVIGKEEVRSKK